MKNIILTGYNGSGATAMRNLLMEYKNCDTIKRKSYEHILFYTPNGLFDLEYKLLLRNSQTRSDEAIESFKKEMYRLWENDFFWCGAYKSLYGNEFKELYEEFVNKLVQFQFKGSWSYDLVKEKHSLVRTFKDICKKALGKNVTHFGRVLEYKKDDTISCSLVSKEEFFKHAREFINDYFKMVNKNKADYFVYEHLLKPYDIGNLDKYFDDGTKVIIVDRDVRDIYIYGKYVVKNSKYPKEPEKFIDFWTRLRNIEPKIDNKNILRVYFEDLIFNYDKTVSKIEEFLGIDSTNHTEIDKYFNLEKSKGNAELYLQKEEWREEVKIFDEKLKDYYYVKGR